MIQFHSTSGVYYLISGADLASSIIGFTANTTTITGVTLIGTDGSKIVQVSLGTGLKLFSTSASIIYDTTAPSITGLSLISGQTVSGTFTLTGLITDNVALSGITIS